MIVFCHEMLSIKYFIFKIKICGYVLVVAGGPSLASNSVVSGLVPSSPIISPGTVPLSAGAIQP